MPQTVQMNQSLSVDCVVFGFNGKSLKVLLVERKYYVPNMKKEYKLPGSMILENETLPEAAHRVLSEMTGLKDVFLKQTQIFSDPQRVDRSELEWISRYHDIHTERVVTVGYYALVRLTTNMIARTTARGASWADVDAIRHLAMDHKEILTSTLSILCDEITHSSVIFELLPHRFTIRQLQNAYSVILGLDIDNRNFRKKIFASGLLVPTGDKEKGVAHKPAEYFTFNRGLYNKNVKKRLRYGFIF
ncbi:NUDIX domain-containing protein [uncultured Alistipes sp.]|uniref:NUDIX hydrolase n=1 Tax=uncultured Alistipes sp. TaxID=538949 RepID=UPI0025D16414|nr:NUDIX domain-containing protein [uncultured Alistipes sp.]